MLIVSNYTSALLYSFTTTVLWGIWGITYKISADRFKIPAHVFVVDWMLSVCLSAFVLGGLFGTDLIFTGAPDSSTANWQFFDNLIHNLNWRATLLLCTAGACAFLGNFLLLAGTQMAGMAIAVCTRDC
jgi:hypothetical protein